MATIWVNLHTNQEARTEAYSLDVTASYLLCSFPRLSWTSQVEKDSISFLGVVIFSYGQQAGITDPVLNIKFFFIAYSV